MLPSLLVGPLDLSILLNFLQHIREPKTGLKLLQMSFIFK